jgi:hypothetical protein
MSKQCESQMRTKAGTKAGIAKIARGARSAAVANWSCRKARREVGTRVADAGIDV